VTFRLTTSLQVETSFELGDVEGDVDPDDGGVQDTTVPDRTSEVL